MTVSSASDEHSRYVAEGYKGVNARKEHIFDHLQCSLAHQLLPKSEHTRPSEVRTYHHLYKSNC